MDTVENAPLLCNPCDAFKSCYGDFPFYCTQYSEECNGNYRAILIREKNNAVDVINSYLSMQGFEHRMSSRTSGEDANVKVRLECKPGHKCSATMTLKCTHDPIRKTVSYAITNVGPNHHVDAAGNVVSIHATAPGQIHNELFSNGAPVTKAIHYAGYGFLTSYEYMNRIHSAGQAPTHSVPEVASSPLGVTAVSGQGCCQVVCRDNVMPLPGILVTLDSDGYASSRGQGGLVTPLRRLDAGDARKSAVVTTSTLQQLLGYARRNGHCAPVDPEYTSSGRLTGYAVLSTTPNASLLRGNCWDEVWTSALEKPLQSITLCPGFVIHEVQLAHPLDDVDYADLFEELSEFTDCTSHDDSSNTTSGPTTPLGNAGAGSSNKRPRLDDSHNAAYHSGSDQDSLSTLSMSLAGLAVDSETSTHTATSSSTTLSWVGGLGKLLKLLVVLAVASCCLLSLSDWTENELPEPTGVPTNWTPAMKGYFDLTTYPNHNWTSTSSSVVRHGSVHNDNSCARWTDNSVDARLKELYRKTGRFESFDKVPRNKRCTKIELIEGELAALQEKQKWINVAAVAQHQM